MWKALLALALVFLLFPTTIFAQEKADKPPTLGIKLTNTEPYSYKDDDGKTVVIGEVQNTKNFPITGVKVWVGFSNANGQLLESTVGNTILDVIPPLGTSPFVIKSKNDNPAITRVSVNLLGFNSSPVKQQSLAIKPDTLEIGDSFSLSGNITNNGLLESSNTKIHFIAYDVFFPPRTVQIETAQIDALQPGSTDSFEFDAKLNNKAASFKLVAESNNYLSAVTPIQQVSLDALTKLVTISDISIRDSDENPILASEIFVGNDVYIQSGAWIQYSADQKISEQPYVYYTQIKRSGEKPIVEFIGFAEGTFESASKQFPKVKWTPETDGLFFIETYIWDKDNVAIASPGPITLVHVKP